MARPKKLSEADGGDSPTTPLAPTPSAEGTDTKNREPLIVEVPTVLSRIEAVQAEPTSEPKPEVKEGPKTCTYRVWAHGNLYRNGAVYKPGDTLTLPEDVARTICCLEMVS